MPDFGGPDPLATLRATLFGDMTVEAWTTPDAAAVGEPWASFERARQLALAGHSDEAAVIWWQLAFTDGLESRPTLQAWHFIRQTRRAAPEDIAKTVLGVIIEMPMEGSHDVLAAYLDGSARYLNYSGKAVVVEDRSNAQIQAAIAQWIAVGTSIVPYIEPADDGMLPRLTPGEMRMVMLTPSGPHFGQGPTAVLQDDAMAGAFMKGAMGLLQLIIG